MKTTDKWVKDGLNRRSNRCGAKKVTIAKRPNDLLKYRLYVSGRKVGNFENIIDALKYLDEL